MNVSLLIIISLTCIIMSLLLYIAFDKLGKIKGIMQERYFQQNKINENYEQYLKYVEEIIKRLHIINLEIIDIENKLKLKNSDYTIIKFDTNTINKFNETTKKKG